MHARLCSLASELGKTTQPEMPEVVPDSDALRLWQTSRLAWIEAATDADSANAVARTLLGWREELGHDPSSVAILVASKVFGATLARLLDEIDVRTQHVFHVTAAAQDEEGGSVEERTRNRKRTFVPRDERSKVSTIHSFKGWEAERVIVVLGGGRSRSSWTARRLFVAITRASSELVVVGHEDSFGLRRLMPDAPPQPAGPVPNIAGRYEVVSRVVAAELRRPGSRNGSRPGPRAAPSGHA